MLGEFTPGRDRNVVFREEIQHEAVCESTLRSERKTRKETKKMKPRGKPPRLYFFLPGTVPEPLSPLLIRGKGGEGGMKSPPTPRGAKACWLQLVI